MTYEKKTIAQYFFLGILVDFFFWDFWATETANRKKTKIIGFRPRLNGVQIISQNWATFGQLARGTITAPAAIALGHDMGDHKANQGTQT